MSTGSKVGEMFIRPAIVGGLAYIFSYFYDGGGTAIIGGTRIGMNTFYALTTAGASIIGQTLKQWVLPYLPQNSQYANLESAVLLPALTGLVDGFAIRLLTGREGFMEGLVVGAASEVGGGYIYQNILQQYIS